jgi:sugar phosphate isomerase/epimerase
MVAAVEETPLRTQNASHTCVSRRGFLYGLTTTGAAAALARPIFAAAVADQNAAPPAKPNSVFSGVHIGCITYSYRGAINTAEDTLKALLEDGLSETELMDGPIRAYAGITVGRGGRGRRGQPATRPPELTDAQRAQQRETQLAKCADLRKMYNDAGVNIHCEKLPFGQSDEEINFNFEVAKALGCKAITVERSEALARRLAPFAEKHKIWVAFHNHTSNFPVTDGLDPILAIGQYIGFNLDIGHYFAGTKGKSPVPVIEKYHDRIISLHLKDRTADGGNLPWGQGKTPIKEALQLLKKEKWPIYADIELEYPIPPGSSSVAEVNKCVLYCREVLA